LLGLTAKDTLFLLDQFLYGCGWITFLQEGKFWMMFDGITMSSSLLLQNA
jgi:hypothetical protein